MPEAVNLSKAVVATPTRAEDIKWMEASVWTSRMVEALVNGVKGGKWHSIKHINAGRIRTLLNVVCSP
jgi:hypothetical protein